MSEPAALPAPEPLGEWRHTSPLSFLVSAITGLKSVLFPMAAVLFGSQGWDGGWIFVVPAIAGMIGFSALFTYIAWRHFRYRLGDSDIRVERGLLSRTARSVPYERIQDVSLEQKLVPRLFGMVDVKFETAAGGKEEVRIRYVSAAEAEELRETVRAHKSGEVVQAGQPLAEMPVEEPSRTLFEMGLKRLVTFGLFEFSLVVFAVLGGAAQQFDFLLPFDIWNPEVWWRLLAGPGDRLRELGFAAQVIGAAIAFALLAILGLVTGLGRTVLRDYGFRLEQTPKGLRRRRGLLTRVAFVADPGGEELRALAATEAADGSCVTCHEYFLLLELDAAALRRPATIVGNRRDVADHRDLHARRLERAERRLAAAARTLDVDAERADAVLLGFTSAILCGDLCGEGRRLLRALEPLGATARPGDGVAADVGDRDDRVVEGRLDVGDARLDVLLDLLLRLLGNHASVRSVLLTGDYFFVAIFLPAIVLAGPLRVRALVWVR